MANKECPITKDLFDGQVRVMRSRRSEDWDLPQQDYAPGRAFPPLKINRQEAVLRGEWGFLCEVADDTNRIQDGGSSLLVKDLMHTSVLTIAPDAGLDRALVIMNTKRIRHLPVVENGKMIGLISNRDLHLSMVEQTGPQNAPKGMYLPALTKIRAVMKTNVVALKPEDTLFEAARVMCEKKIGCLPVVNTDGSVAGIVTETDMLQLLVKLLQEKEA